MEHNVVKTLILAGGYGSRLAEETEVRPKPMVEIGGQPILWHIMKSYSGYGFDDFVVALGYKGEYIKKYFAEYGSLAGNLTVQLRNGSVVRHDEHRRVVDDRPDRDGPEHRDGGSDAQGP